MSIYLTWWEKNSHNPSLYNEGWCHQLLSSPQTWLPSLSDSNTLLSTLVIVIPIPIRSCSTSFFASFYAFWCYLTSYFALSTSSLPYPWLLVALFNPISYFWCYWVFMLTSFFVCMVSSLSALLYNTSLTSLLSIPASRKPFCTSYCATISTYVNTYYVALCILKTPYTLNVHKAQWLLFHPNNFK